MTKTAVQELLPPARFSAHPTDQPGFLRWLIEPVQDRMFLPLAGLWILGLDWLLFPPEAATLTLATPFASFVGFVLGTLGVYQMQRRFGRDDKPHATLKALLAGLVIGLPFSMAGTVVGAWILGMSGLIHLRDRMLRR